MRSVASGVRIVVWRSVLSGGPGPSPLEGGAREGESPVVPGPCRTRGAVGESGCLGMQPQSGGKFRPRLNTGERPIANKYREGKMKRTLKRESRVLEIVGREADGGRRCVPVGCGTARAGLPIDSGHRPTRIAVVAQARAAEMLAETSSPRSWTAARADPACLGTCAPRASACGLPIRPVLKHGPRSLTCVRVSGRANPRGARKLSGGIPPWVAPPTDPDLL
ncbi:hypothetical protein E2542_SST30141 [Spatholobus suberectus]|nr:hypothetical protein E2542_SST30141 [Spatholobus suberectus]